MNHGLAHRGPDADLALSTLVRETLHRRGADPFIRSPGGAVVTYGDAGRRSARVARALVRFGVQPGDRVVVQIEKSTFAVLLYLACLRAGAVYVPLNTAYTDPEVDYVLTDVDPTVVVRDPRRAEVETGHRVVTADGHGRGTLAATVRDEDEEFADAQPGPADPAAILYTSGTTGRPKGAVLSQANLASNARDLCSTWQFGADDVLLHALPLFHTHGLFVATNCVIASGSSLHLLPRFDVTRVIEQLPHSTVFMGIPTHYTRLLADGRLDRHLCAGMRLFTSGSAPLPASVHEEFASRTGHAIVERYGMTETSIITSNPLGAERAGTVGLPLPSVELRLGEPGDPGSEPGRPGATGAIEVRGPNVFDGYWRRPDLRQSDFTSDGYFRTGDLGTLDADGYLTIVGRSKDVIISGGYNVYPKEVEDVLGSLEGVIESTVVGLPDADLGERVVAVVVPRADGALTEEAIRSGARRQLASYKVPKEVHFATSLPRNTMGKVQKSELRARLSEVQES